MKTCVLLLSALLSPAALAASADEFSPNTDCTGTACTAFNNSAPDVTVSHVSPYFTGTVSVTVDGVTYRGRAVFTSTLVSQSPQLTRQLWHYDNNFLTASDGSTLLLTLDVYRSAPAAAVDSGEASYTVLGGTVLLL
jgi:hypothetical protein